MKNTLEVKVNTEVLKHTGMTEEMLFRELARKMVTEMPINELKKLIRFEVIDPVNSENKAMPYQDDIAFKDEIAFMRDNNLVLYKAECNL